MSVPETSQASTGLADRIPLSLNQEFLCAFDKGDAEGAFSHRHTLVFGWRINGEIDIDTLRGALDDVVARHETLRTSIVRGGDDRHQEIHPPSPVELVVRDLSGGDPATRDVQAEELVNELDAGTYSVAELPHLRAVLGRFADDDAVLVLIAHHTATDSWSIELIIRDLAAFYAARRGHGPVDLPQVHQYREFAVWQQENLDTDAMNASREYWRGKLRDAQILAIPTDRPRSAEVVATYSVYRFLIDAELTSATMKFAKTTRSSPFMVMLAAYNVLLNKMTGATDIVVPTFTSGRYQDRFLDTVGPFFNFVPLRTDISACGTFREVVDRARETCIDVYTHDIPFAQVVNEVPDLIRPFAEPDRSVVAFEVLQSPMAMDGEVVGDLKYSEVRRRLLSQPVGSDIPDGALWAMDVLPSGEIVGSLKFNGNLFDESTMITMVSEFRRVLGRAVAAPDAPLTEIQAP
ncbi:condensation domain-containing protein [Streptosporangium sp. CA-135522]|uniref:condensation domain-containing protein n=1 Tax=Streptosporangium sp. CA-135522 TaxID=3240072 RepID=UPI003D9044DC